MERSYKFRLYPNREQEVLIQKTFGCVRFVYNHFLDERIQQYNQTGKAPTRFQQDKSLTTLKKNLEWLREPDKCALQETLKNLDAAYQNFFRRVKQGERLGFPHFKRKHDHHKSYKTNSNIKMFDEYVQLPKLSKVKCKVSKRVDGRIKSYAVTSDGTEFANPKYLHKAKLNLSNYNVNYPENKRVANGMKKQGFV